MKLIEEFEGLCKRIKDHVGYEGFIESYQIETSDQDSYWQTYFDDKSIKWSENKEDVLEDSGNAYSCETRGIFRGEEITLALVDSDFGNELYWLVLDSNKELNNYEY